MIRRPPRSTLFPHDALPIFDNVNSALAVPLRHKGKVLGALNLLSDRKDAFEERDEVMLRQFAAHVAQDRKSTRLNSSHSQSTYAVFCLKKKKNCTGVSVVRK